MSVVGLNWYRSWPSVSEFAEGNLEHKRDYVMDHIPKIIIDKRGYQTAREYNSLQACTGTEFQGWPDDKPGFCMLEWDVALDPYERRLFAAEALVEPREVLVAPYRLFDVWCMYNNPGAANPGLGPDSQYGRQVRQNLDERTDSFGLGCIYFPTVILREFLQQMDHFGFTDGTFGKWYYEKYGPCRVTWRVHPQHLHEYDNEPS